VNPPVKVAVPPGVVTTTSFVPSVPFPGIVKATEVSETDKKVVMSTVPTLILVVPVKFEPKIFVVRAIFLEVELLVSPVTVGAAAA
jgi:hypothetical protein